MNALESNWIAGRAVAAAADENKSVSSQPIFCFVIYVRVVRVLAGCIEAYCCTTTDENVSNKCASFPRSVVWLRYAFAFAFCIQWQWRARRTRNVSWEWMFFIVYYFISWYAQFRLFSEYFIIIIRLLIYWLFGRWVCTWLSIRFWVKWFDNRWMGWLMGMREGELARQLQRVSIYCE